MGKGWWLQSNGGPTHGNDAHARDQHFGGAKVVELPRVGPRVLPKGPTGPAFTSRWLLRNGQLSRGVVMSAVMRAEVTLHIDAPPDRVWGLVTDITKMGEYSPEVIEAEWIDGATGPVVGARYRGHVKRNENWPVLYWTTCKVTESQPGEVFEFAVIMRERPVNTWRYDFRATDDGGTDVTESFDLGDNLFTKVWHPLGGFLRERRNQRDMLRTLERVKAVAEQS